MTTFLDRWRARLDAFPQSALQLLMRFSVFWMFWRSGSLKADDIEQAISPFRDEYGPTKGRLRKRRRPRPGHGR